ncbi:MAG: Rne/Rng family ribonuclease [Deltaproteobacteria bacterium]|nr:Rne/Rng family ribonuclease [Deltaproteobacteria bacterium]
MSGNLLVINVDLPETRVALVENGILVELHLERHGSRSTLGNVYLGKVSRVLPGMQAAFIDIGQGRAAFLHVEDLIRPDDFEAYLSGGREVLGLADDEGWTAPAQAEPGAATVEEDENAEDRDAGAAPDEPEPPDEEAEPDEGAPAGEAETEAGAADAPAPPADEEAEAGAAGGEAGPSENRAGAQGDAAGRRRRRTRVPRSARAGRQGHGPAQRRAEAPGDRPRRGDRVRGRGAGPAKGPRGRIEGARISKSTPIREVVREGQQVVVQISKEPISTKGARVTSHISLPGRYVVYLPTVEHVGVSRRIGSARERVRLREVVATVKPPSGGLVVRTVAEGLTKKHLKADVGYLVRLWDDIAKRRDAATSVPCCLYEELDLVLKAARDLFTEDVDKIVIDDREQYGRLRRFIEMFMPERAQAIELYEGSEPLFDAYGFEDEIGRALSRKVPLASGGYLVIDEAEALTAIDVNTGRFVGKGSKDLEETIVRTNLEAVEEIAYQLRFRNLGGLIILDLIDMEKPGNRTKVRRRLDELLARDKVRTTVNRISELGLIEMTRKRTRESLGRLMHEACFYCDGTGWLQAKQTIAYEILRQIRRERMNLRGYKVTVNAHPAIVDLLQHEEEEALKEAERRFERRIELCARKEYHLEQFDLQGI